MGCSSSSIRLKDEKNYTEELTGYVMQKQKFDKLDECIMKNNGTQEGIKEITNEIISIKQQTMR